MFIDLIEQTRGSGTNSSANDDASKYGEETFVPGISFAGFVEKDQQTGYQTESHEDLMAWYLETADGEQNWMHATTFEPAGQPLERFS